MTTIDEPFEFEEIVPLGERLIARSTHFICVPSLGQLVEGYCLILPTRSVCNILQLRPSEKQELLDFVARIGAAIKKAYGDYLVFEHGSVTHGDSVACGMNWAHFHLVPRVSGTDVVRWLTESTSVVASVAYPDLAAWLHSGSPSQSYVVVSDAAIGARVFDYVPPRQSQIVRRAIASLLHQDRHWDWKLSGVESEVWKTKQNIERGLTG